MKLVEAVFNNPLRGPVKVYVDAVGVAVVNIWSADVAVLLEASFDITR